MNDSAAFHLVCELIAIDAPEGVYLDGCTGRLAISDPILTVVEVLELAGSCSSFTVCAVVSRVRVTTLTGPRRGISSGWMITAVDSDGGWHTTTLTDDGGERTETAPIGGALFAAMACAVGLDVDDEGRVRRGRCEDAPCCGCCD